MESRARDHDSRQGQAGLAGIYLDDIPLRLSASGVHEQRSFQGVEAMIRGMKNYGTQLAEILSKQ